MSKRSNQKAARSNTKKARTATMPTLVHLALSNLDLEQLKSAFKLKIDSADYAGSRALVKTLESLQQKAKRHEKKVKPEGLLCKKKEPYDGIIECDCGNNVEAGGEYYTYCVHCTSEDDPHAGSCIFCVTKTCKRCDQGVCDKCFEELESCQKCRKGPMCFECLDECRSCEKWFCRDCNYVDSFNRCKSCENL